MFISVSIGSLYSRTRDDLLVVACGTVHDDMTIHHVCSYLFLQVLSTIIFSLTVISSTLFSLEGDRTALFTLSHPPRPSKYSGALPVSRCKNQLLWLERINCWGSSVDECMNVNFSVRVGLSIISIPIRACMYPEVCVFFHVQTGLYLRFHSPIIVCCWFAKRVLFPPDSN